MAAARGREAALSRPMDENEHNTEIPAHRAVAHPLLDRRLNWALLILMASQNLNKKHGLRIKGRCNQHLIPKTLNMEHV